MSTKKTPSEATPDEQCRGWRINIEAVGLRQSDAAAYVLKLIGNMMQEAHTKGHSCGGTEGNASGKWEAI